jgi:cell division protein FtsL
MKKFYIAIFLILGVAAIVAISRMSWQEAKRGEQINQEIENLRQEAERIRKNNQGMRERITYFETPEFKESIAKEKLNMQKPDEQVVIVKPSEYYENSQISNPSEQGETPEDNLPNYAKWWNQFFKY